MFIARGGSAYVICCFGMPFMMLSFANYVLVVSSSVLVWKGQERKRMRLLSFRTSLTLSTGSDFSLKFNRDQRLLYSCLHFFGCIDFDELERAGNEPVGCSAVSVMMKDPSRWEHWMWAFILYNSVSFAILQVIIYPHLSRRKTKTCWWWRRSV